MRIIPMLCAIALVAPLAATSQETTGSTWPLASGARVRILSPALGEKRETGTVVSATNESIVFQRKTLTSHTLGVGDITQIDVAQGTHSRKMKGAGWGFLIGGVVTAGITAATWQKPKNGFDFMDFGRGGDAAFAGVFGGLLGGIVGAIVGAKETDSWVPVRLPAA